MTTWQTARTGYRSTLEAASTALSPLRSPSGLQLELQLAGVHRRPDAWRLRGVHRGEHLGPGLQGLNRLNRCRTTAVPCCSSNSTVNPVASTPGGGPPASFTSANIPSNRSLLTSVNRTTRTYIWIPLSRWTSLDATPRLHRSPSGAATRPYPLEPAARGPRTLLPSSASITRSASAAGTDRNEKRSST